MNNKTNLLLITLSIFLLISGCGKNTEVESTANTIKEAPPISSETSNDEKEPDVWNPAVVQRQMLFDEKYIAGVLFLGYVDGNAGDLEHNRDYYQSVFEAQGYLEDFPFLAEIPNSNFVQTKDGQELYCIIPQDHMATVSVNQWIVNEENDFNGEAGEVLYRSESGSPILLKCNVSEIIPDVEVLIVDNKNNQLHWCPYLSGMDGSVVVESADGKLYDFTKYADNEYAESLDVLVGETYDYYWHDEYETTLASVTAPIVKLGEETAENYPELSAALAENIEARKTKLYDNYKNLIPMAEEFYPDFAEYFTEFEAREEAMIRRADSIVLSVLYRGTAYEGGVHGYYYCFGENYDAQTGKLLNLEDVVTDMEAFPELVKEQLYTFWEPLSFYQDLDLNEYFEENLEFLAWTLDHHGITIYFNPYEIAPYASGMQIVTVAFANHPEVFAEEYTRGPESYGIQLDMESPFYFDVDADGELDEVLVSGMVSDDMIHVEHNIYINGKCYAQSNFENYDLMPEEPAYISAYEVFNPHMVHLADGRNYLFIENMEDSDMKTNTVYELTGGSVKLIETIYSSLYTEVNEESWGLLDQAITNPYNFKLESRTWVVGTHDGFMTYYIGDDGHTYSYEDYYTFDHQPVFTAKKAFKLNLIDEYGTVGESLVVEAGTVVRYHRTDASLYADFILPDGQIGRADLEWDGGSCSIDGISVEELFEGVVFAG